MERSLCSGAMTDRHDGSDPQPVRIGIPSREVIMCRPCRDAAGRQGLINRRVEDRDGPAAEAIITFDDGLCDDCDQPLDTHDLETEH